MLGAGIAAVLIFIVLVFVGWFENPGLGPGLVIIGALAGCGRCRRLLFTNLDNRRVLCHRDIGPRWPVGRVGLLAATQSSRTRPCWQLAGARLVAIAVIGVAIAAIFGGYRPRRGGAGFGDHLCSSSGSWSFIDHARLQLLAAYSATA